MIKALVIGLSLLLSFGVASAKPKKKRTRKRPVPVHAPVTGDKQPAPAPDASPPLDAPPSRPPPEATDDKVPATTDLSPPPASQPGAQPSPAARPDANPAPAAAHPPDAKRSGPMKTDEKAAPNATLDKSSAAEDYRNVSPDEERKALKAFREGNAHLNDGFFMKAAEKYREALSHWNHPAIHYNLALALINLDQPIEVFDELTRAMAHGPPALGDKEKFDRAKGYLKLVEGQLADIEVSCDKIGAKVAVDGKDVFIAPGKYTAKVRVGKHTFYAEKQGYNARVNAPFIGPGEKFRIELKVYTPEELTRHRRRWQSTWLPYAVLGAGAAVGLGAGALELSAQSSYDEFNARVAACNTMAAGCALDTPGITTPRDSGDTKRLLGYVGYGVAGAAIATGATLLWLNRRQAYQISPDELEAASAPVAITPIVSPDVMGAMVQGHF
jgi:hypothetical protein